MSDSKLNLVVQFTGIDKLSGGLKNLIGLGRSGSQALGALRREARDLKGELAKVQAELARGSGNITELAQRERELEAAIARSNQQLERQKRLLEIDATTDRVKAHGEALKEKGAKNMATGAGIGAAVFLLAKGAMDFNGELTDVGIKLGLNVQRTRVLGSEVMRAAEFSNQLPSNMLRAADALASAGVSATAIPSMLANIGKVGVATNSDLGDLALASASNMTNLGIAAEETGLALGVMAAAGKSGRFELKTMTQYFPALAARAGAFGQKGLAAVADLSAASQIAARAVGGNGEAAATNLENLLAKINTEETRKKFGKMGVDLKSEMDKALAQGMSPVEAISVITERTLKKNGGMSNLSLLFGDMQAQNALLPMIKDLEEFRIMRAQALRDAPLVMMDFARKSGDASIQLQAVTGGLQTAGIELGGAFLPHLVEMAKTVMVISRGVADWVREHPALTSALAQGVIYLATFNVGLGALRYAFGSILGPMATAWGWYKKFKLIGGIAGIVAKVVGAFRLLRSTIGMVSNTFRAVGALMLANPIVLAVVAIAAAAALIYVYWEPISAFFVGLWGRIKSVWSGVSAWFGQLWAGVKSTFSKYGVELLAGVFPMLGIPMLIYKHWGAISGFFRNVWSGIKSAASSGVSWFASLPGKFASFGAAMISGLVNALSPTALTNRLLSIARSGITAFKNFFGIKSPSRLFMEMGGHMTTGLGLGIDRGGNHPLRSMARLATGVAGAGALSLSGPAFAGSGTGPGAGAGLAARAPAQAAAPITINVYQQPGEDGQALADRIVEVLAKAQRKAALSTYGDDF